LRYTLRGPTRPPRLRYTAVEKQKAEMTASFSAALAQLPRVAKAQEDAVSSRSVLNKFSAAVNLRSRLGGNILPQKKITSRDAIRDARRRFNMPITCRPSAALKSERCRTLHAARTLKRAGTYIRHANYKRAIMTLANEDYHVSNSALTDFVCRGTDFSFLLLSSFSQVPSCSIRDIGLRTTSFGLQS